MSARPGAAPPGVAPEAAPASPAAPPSSRGTLLGVAFALVAAVSYGSSQVLTRQAVGDLASPLVGSFIALCWGTLGFALLTARAVRAQPPRPGRGFAFFAAAGVFSSAGVTLMFLALSRGQVVVLSPVLATNPLFTLVFASLLLRGVERITRRHVAGTALVVLGVAVLSLG